MKKSIYVGWDSREADAYDICVSSIKRHLTQDIPVNGLFIEELRQKEIYTRPTIREGEKLIDVKSIRHDYNGAMSTEFALSRFLVPHLAKEGWALFMDCDMLVRKDISKVFDLCDPDKAVMCVKHEYFPSKREKMDGQIQTPYEKKNWSSFMIFNCNHPANIDLTLFGINNYPGRMLHQFYWLTDDQIGDLPQEWNFLIGESKPIEDPSIAHFTLGTPDFPGYEDVPFADEWRSYVVH